MGLGRAPVALAHSMSHSWRLLQFVNHLAPETSVGPGDWGLCELIYQIVLKTITPSAFLPHLFLLPSLPRETNQKDQIVALRHDHHLMGTFFSPQGSFQFCESLRCVESPSPPQMRAPNDSL